MKILSKPFITNIAIIVVSTIVALLLAELALRTVGKDGTPQATVVPDEILGHRAIENFNGKDKNGFRNVSVPEQADIVVLGDSQTESLNAETDEAWPQVLGTLASTTVYQMALGGYGTVQYSHFIDQALEFDPKLVIVGLYMGNDIYDTYDLTYKNDNWKHLRDDEFIREQKASGAEDFLSYDLRLALKNGIELGSAKWYWFKTRLWVREHSRLYTLLGNGTRSLREKIGVARNNEQKKEEVKEFTAQNPDLGFVYDTEPMIATVMSPQYRLAAVDVTDPRAVEGLRITKVLLNDMRTKTKNAGAEFAVVIIPTKEAVYGEYFRENEVPVTQALADIIEKEIEISNNVLAFCAEEQMYCTEVVDGFADALSSGERVYPESIDGHSYAPGYNAIAEGAYEFLAEKGLLKK